MDMSQRLMHILIRARNLSKTILRFAFPRLTLAWQARCYRSLAVEREIQLLPMLCRRDRVSIDVGAHDGIYSYWMRQFSLAIELFEPHPQQAKQLRRALPTTKVYQLALSDSEGQTMLTVPITHGMTRTALGSIEAHNLPVLASIERKSYPVLCRRLDRVIAPDVPIGFIKIDVEGHELAVLRGAEKILTLHHPILLIEAEERHRPNAVHDIYYYLESLGYSGWFCTSEGLQPLSSFSALLHQDLNPQRKTPYINNFLFADFDLPSRLRERGYT